MNPCSQIDHPFIILSEMVASFFLFKMFFLTRRMSFPLPQFCLSLAVVLLWNAKERYTDSGWFITSNVTMFVLAAVVIVVAYYSIVNFVGEEAKKPDAAIELPDYFSTIETKAVWGFGLVILTLLAWYSMDLYSDRNVAVAEKLIAVDSTKAVVTKEHTEAIKTLTDSVSATLTGIQSVSARQTKGLQNQAKGLANQAEIKSKLDRQEKRNTKKQSKKASGHPIIRVDSVSTNQETKQLKGLPKLFDSIKRGLKLGATAKADTTHCID